MRKNIFRLFLKLMMLLFVISWVYVVLYLPVMRNFTCNVNGAESVLIYTLNQVTEKTLNEVVDYDYDELIGGDRILTIKYTNANFDNTKTINHYKGLIKEGWNIFEETNDEVKLKKDNMYMYISQNKKIVEIKLAYVDTRWGTFRLNM